MVVKQAKHPVRALSLDRGRIVRRQPSNLEPEAQSAHRGDDVGLLEDELPTTCARSNGSSGNMGVPAARYVMIAFDSGRYPCSVSNTGVGRG